MRSYRFFWKPIFLRLVFSAVPVALLASLRLATGTPLSWGELASCWALVATLLTAARWTQPVASGGVIYTLPWSGVVAMGTGLAAAVIYAVSGDTYAAWILLGALYLLFLGLDRVLTHGRGALSRWGARGLLALGGGMLVIAIVQVESRFAEEEFFAVVQGLALGLFGFLLLALEDWVSGREPALDSPGLRFDRRWLGPVLILIALFAAGLTIGAYQRSFYPPQAPTYDGISDDTPFLCGETRPDPEAFDGPQVFARLLERVEAHPQKGPPEFGMLALGTGDNSWAEAFRDSLLQEARQGQFTEPANSVKWTQYEAALRAYYLVRVDAAFPDLFSADNLASLHAWFDAINHRALTVEWVDCLYGLALKKWPEGLYENQENGAGLLALLESEGLAATELSPANRAYLERERRGWNARFRNTDDAYIYQPEWINNAYFQWLYTGTALQDNTQRSFEWLLLQAPPDATALRYNHPGSPALAGAAYFGAILLQDPRYVWLAGRALADMEAQGGHIPAQPGAEQPVSLTGLSPSEGSCLLYGDSGLPNQKGPLAPDKIVFRDGWSRDSAYLLLNLRFTGWHRYKATNAISLVYKNGPLADEDLTDQRFRWLPVGRSLLRDKRIPRENLNGLLIARSGMSAVLNVLTGIGGPWAQDPPFYAEVLAFETSPEMDWSHTRLADWRGWQHDRWIYFHHNNGPIVVVDDATGPSGAQAALAWHLLGEPTRDSQRILLRSGDHPTEALLVPLGADTARIEMTEGHGAGTVTSVIYHPQTESRLRLVTLFLLGPWVGAEAEFDPSGQVLRIVQGQNQISLPLYAGE